MNCINFNCGGDLLVSGSDDTTVKIWNLNSGRCLDTLLYVPLWLFFNSVIVDTYLMYLLAISCPTAQTSTYSSVLSANVSREIISGSNDSDIRHFDIEKRICTTYAHHSKKVLGISINPIMPQTFLSCSADGTVQLIDLRLRYEGMITSEIKQNMDEADEDSILPQAFGGGRRGSRRVCRSQ